MAPTRSGGVSEASGPNNQLTSAMLCAVASRFSLFRWRTISKTNMPLFALLYLPWQMQSRCLIWLCYLFFSTTTTDNDVTTSGMFRLLTPRRWISVRLDVFLHSEGNSTNPRCFWESLQKCKKKREKKP